MLHDVLLRRRSVLNLSLPLIVAVSCAVFRAAGKEYYPAKLAAKQRESAESAFANGHGLNERQAVTIKRGCRKIQLIRKI